MKWDRHVIDVAAVSAPLEPIAPLSGGHRDCCGGTTNRRKSWSATGDGIEKDEYARALGDGDLVLYGDVLTEGGTRVKQNPTDAHAASAISGSRGMWDRAEHEEIESYLRAALENVYHQRKRIAVPRVPRTGTVPASKGRSVDWHNIERVALVDGPATSALARSAIESATKRVWVTQFLIDVRPSEDRYGEVRWLLHSLVAAARRGVDVRVLVPVVPASRGTPYDVNEPAARFLLTRGVSVLSYSPTNERPRLHAKASVIDTLVIVGNGNWTPRSFRVNSEIGVAIRSASLADVWSGRFRSLWQRARKLPRARQAAGAPRQSYANDPGHVFRSQGTKLLHELSQQVDGAGRGEIALAAGQVYVRELRQALDRAVSRVFVCMLGLRTTRAARLRPLFDGVVAAHRRGVDVRVLIDPGAGVREFAATDAVDLSEAGIPVRRWPFRSRLHARTVVVDGTAFVGSIGWTPASVFLTEEVAAVVREATVSAKVADRFGQWWEAAGSAPSHWPIALSDMPLTIQERCQAAGIATFGELLRARREIGGVSGQSWDYLVRLVSAIATCRVPPAIAALVARDRVTCAELAEMGAADVEHRLRKFDVAKSVRDLAPVGSYFAAFATRRVQQ